MNSIKEQHHGLYEICIDLENIFDTVMELYDTFINNNLLHKQHSEYFSLLYNNDRHLS